jgi:hypothetical protein
VGKALALLDYQFNDSSFWTCSVLRVENGSSRQLCVTAPNITLNVKQHHGMCIWLAKADDWVFAQLPSSETAPLGGIQKRRDKSILIALSDWLATAGKSQAISRPRIYTSRTECITGSWVHSQVPVQSKSRGASSMPIHIVDYSYKTYQVSSKRSMRMNIHKRSRHLSPDLWRRHSSESFLFHFNWSAGSQRWCTQKSSNTGCVSMSMKRISNPSKNYPENVSIVLISRWGLSLRPYTTEGTGLI